MRQADNQDGTFTNPVIFADYPDPDIIRVGEDFYMASSSFTDAPGVPICHSQDLVNWQVVGHAYDRLPASNPAYRMAEGAVAYRGGSWAPSLRYDRGVFYVCFNTPAEGFFLCASPAPEGSYEMTGFGGVELYDPGLFFDDDHRAYVVHGANDIFLSALTADKKSVDGPPCLLYSTCYGNPLEGSHVYKRGSFYYICNTSRAYNSIQVMYRARSLRGPSDSRVVCADDLNYSGAGLHQGGFVELADGETWFFLFQDRDYVGRVPVLLPVTWEDDWPRVGDPKNFWKAPVTCRTPLPTTGKSAATEGSDDFQGGTLGLHWHWNHNPDDERWWLTARLGWLRLHSAGACGLMSARNTLTQKITGDGCAGTVKIDVSALQPGDMAGLGVLGFPHACIAAERTLDACRLVRVNVQQRVATGPNVAGANVFLRVQAARDGRARFFYSPDDSSYEPLGDELVMQFSVKSFLGNKFALFCFNAGGAAAGGHADFDFFRYECERGPANRRNAFEEISAALYDAEYGTDTQRSVEKKPHQTLVNLHDGDWARDNHLDFGAGATALEALVSPIGPGAALNCASASQTARKSANALSLAASKKPPALGSASWPASARRRECSGYASASREPTGLSCDSIGFSLLDPSGRLCGRIILCQL